MDGGAAVIDGFRLKALRVPISGYCEVCGTWQRNQHIDLDIEGMICLQCEPHVRAAELQLRAWVQLTEPPIFKLAEVALHPDGRSWNAKRVTQGGRP